MRILENNAVLSATNIVEMPFYQRLFFIASTLVIGDVLTGTSSGVTGGVVVFVGNTWVDIRLLDDINFYYPNQPNNTSELITAASGNTLTSAVDTITNISGRPKMSHPEFPITNLVDNNRNLTIAAKSYLDNLERNFNTLRIGSTFSEPTRVSCIALLSHNFSDTAVISIELFNGVNSVYPKTTISPNIIKSAVSSYRSTNVGSTKAVVLDSDNIPILYLSSEVLVTYAAITIEDYNTQEKYLSLGGLYIGNYWQPSTDVAYGWSNSIVDTSNTIYAQSPYSVERPKYSLYNISIRNLTTTEVSDWQYIFNKNGTHTDIIVDLFHYSKNVEESASIIYGRFGVNNLPITNDYSDRYSISMQFRESI